MSATAASRTVIRSSGSQMPRSYSAPPSWTHSGMFRRISEVGMMSVLEDVGELVNDQPVKQIRWEVDRQHHAVALAFGERQHPFG